MKPNGIFKTIKYIALCLLMFLSMGMTAFADGTETACTGTGAVVCEASLHIPGCDSYIAPLCSCSSTEKCHADAINALCPVCSLEGAELSALCLGTESVIMPSVLYFADQSGVWGNEIILVCSDNSGISTSLPMNYDDKGFYTVSGMPDTAVSLSFSDGSNATAVFAVSDIAAKGLDMCLIRDGAAQWLSHEQWEEEKAFAGNGSDYVAQLNGANFTSLSHAYNAATSGDHIILLRDAEGKGLVINKSITIDFAGYTYTFTEGVGSAGTDSNGFQILQDNSVILKNGTLRVSEASKAQFGILIQNYAELYLQDMTLDGTNLDKSSATTGYSYALSINSGNVTVTGETNMLANDEGEKAYAFDLYDYSSAYPLPSLRIVTTGAVTGNILVSDSIKDKLVVESGSFTADISPYLPENLAQSSDGTVYIDYQAQLNGQNYITLTDACNAAAHGDSITLLRNVECKGLVIDKSLSIDFSGFTYSFDEAVVSAKGESSGLQILQGNTVLLRNGTLKAAEGSENQFTMMVENYGDLSLENMSLDGTASLIALSARSGNVSVSGQSSILAAPVALDVLDCSYEYPLPTVRLATAGTVNGNIQVSDSLKGNLIIEGGSYTAHVSDYLPENYYQGSDGVIYIDYPVQMNGHNYPSLAQAVEAANELSGASISMLKDCSLYGTLEITSPMSICGNGFRLLCREAGGEEAAISIRTPSTTHISIEDLSIETPQRSQKAKRAIAIYSPVSLKLNNVSISGVNNSSLYLAQDSGGSSIELTNSSLIACCALELWGSGSTVNITNCSLTGINDKRNLPENKFGTIMFSEGTHAVTVSGSTISAESGTGAAQDPVLMQRKGDKPADFKLSISDDSFVSPSGYFVKGAFAQVENCYYSMLDRAIDEADGKTVTVLASTAENLSVSEDLGLDLNGCKLSGNVTVSEGAVITLSKGKLEDITKGFSLSSGEIRTDEDCYCLSGNGSIKAVSNGVLITAAPGCSVQLNGSLVTLSKAGSIIAKDNGSIDIPSGSTVSLDNGSLLSVDGGGVINADGTVSQIPFQIKDYGYGGVRLIDSSGNSTGIFVPYGDSVTVGLDKNGSLVYSASGNEAAVIDGKDADELPDLSLADLSGKPSSKFRSGSKNTLKFAFNGFQQGLQKLELSAEELDYSQVLAPGNHFTLSPGVIELNNSFLNELGPGNYTLTLSYIDGQVISVDLAVSAGPVASFLQRIF